MSPRPSRCWRQRKVRYQGEAVAAVVATSAALAADAAELVDVTYAELTCHVDAVAAAADPADPVHDLAPDNLHRHQAVRRRRNRPGTRRGAPGDRAGVPHEPPRRDTDGRPRRGGALEQRPDQADAARDLAGPVPAPQRHRERCWVCPTARCSCWSATWAAASASRRSCIPKMSAIAQLARTARAPSRLDRDPFGASADCAARPRPPLHGAGRL